MCLLWTSLRSQRTRSAPLSPRADTRLNSCTVLGDPCHSVDMAEYEHQGHGRAWAGSSDDQREHDTSRRHRRRWESGNDSRERRRSRSHSPRRYKAQPSSCVIIRGLDPSTTEQDVQAALAPLETPSHLRLVRDHGTGAARFAFAEFGTVERAESVLAAAGSVMLSRPLRLTFRIRESFHVRGAPVHLDFSHSRNRPQGQWRDKRDWTCCRCKGLNFARRQACFKVHTDPPGFSANCGGSVLPPPVRPMYSQCRGVYSAWDGESGHSCARP